MLVACPHYACELLGWLGFVLVFSHPKAWAALAAAIRYLSGQQGAGCTQELQAPDSPRLLRVHHSDAVQVEATCFAQVFPLTDVSQTHESHGK